MKTFTMLLFGACGVAMIEYLLSPLQRVFGESSRPAVDGGFNEAPVWLKPR